MTCFCAVSLSGTMRSAMSVLLEETAFGHGRVVDQHKSHLSHFRHKSLFGFGANKQSRRDCVGPR